MLPDLWIAGPSPLATHMRAILAPKSWGLIPAWSLGQGLWQRDRLVELLRDQLDCVLCLKKSSDGCKTAWLSLIKLNSLTAQSSNQNHTPWYSLKWLENCVHTDIYGNCSHNFHTDEWICKLGYVKIKGFLQELQRNRITTQQKTLGQETSMRVTTSRESVRAVDCIIPITKHSGTIDIV